MKKNQISIKTTAKKMEQVLNEFFLSNELLTKNHLYSYLNIDWITALELKKASSDIKMLLTKAENECELNVINLGFDTDKSFPKYYLDKYQSTPGDVLEQIDSTPEIHIHLDTTPSPHQDIFDES